MTYSTNYIVRFEGTLTQGPNKGKTYTYATSWAGVGFETLEQAREYLAKVRQLEPSLSFKILARTFVGRGFQETVVE